MNYEYELSFCFDIFKKCHIHTTVISSQDSIEAMLDSRFCGIIGLKSDLTVGQTLGMIESNTIYKFTNEFKFQYIYIRLPITSEKNILAIGPYLSSPPVLKDILESAEQAGVPSDAKKALKDYYSSLPILLENDNLFVMINAFCERIWQTSSFAIVELNKTYCPFMLHSDTMPHVENFDEIEANIKAMELRYSFENELIHAVSLGQQHKVNQLVSQLNEHSFEQRLADPLRNAKNYCIIMNTLLRKAAEEGGVHPVYIDKTSSKFAVRIESLTTAKACTDIMTEMFSSYCRLVYKHSMRNYSQIVKKTILIIDSDISAELSLNNLAQKQGVSAGYLATIFKKETGKTVLEYIKGKRIEYAMYLLSTTHLQIQTIALHCGIMDVQYFSKIFKKKTGKSPKEYREAARR